MDVREKLVELLEEAEGFVNNDYPTLEQMADHLIANGVTFATDNNVGCKWISVEERLPERKDPKHKRDFYLVTLSNGMVKELAYEHEDYDNMLFDPGWHPTSSPVTHWMPLPQPPKGE